jgi:signal transduction histidine kinase
VSLATTAGWLAALVVVLAWLYVQRGAAARSEAVTRACHELRGPLAAARLGLDLGIHGRPLSAAQLRAIGSELGRAALALDDLADAHQSGYGERPSGEPGLVELGALLADSVEAWRPSAEIAGTRLEFPAPADPVRVRGERLRLAQAVGNLIANAIEHGGPTTWVELGIEHDLVRVDVRDDGPGLPGPVATLARQARGGRGRRGRGLAIAAGIAAVHGGRLRSLESGPGAHLVLELPAPAAATTGER